MPVPAAHTHGPACWGARVVAAHEGPRCLLQMLLVADFVMLGCATGRERKHQAQAYALGGRWAAHMVALALPLCAAYYINQI